jgi:hypothetical protein
MDKNAKIQRAVCPSLHPVINFCSAKGEGGEDGDGDGVGTSLLISRPPPPCWMNGQNAFLEIVALLLF